MKDLVHIYELEKLLQENHNDAVRALAALPYREGAHGNGNQMG